MAEYDRSTLRSVAQAAGIANPNQLAARLDLPRNTAWRLWHGHGEPAADTAAAVQEHLGLPIATLLARAKTPEPAA